MGSTMPPQPAVDVDSQGFWEALADDRLALQRCVDCRRFQHPPTERCTTCGSAVAYEDLVGAGEVFSFIVVRHPTVPGYLDELPYVVALVELDEQPGLRISARVVGTDPDDVEIGGRVRVSIVDLPGGDRKVPVFVLS